LGDRTPAYGDVRSGRIVNGGVKAVNEVLGSLRLEKPSDKTFIGRIEKGFDFLGYHFSREGLAVARAPIEKFVARAARLYEQERERPEGPSALRLYVRPWVSWVRADLPDRPYMRSCLWSTPM
jgi:hypothetical protein